MAQIAAFDGTNNVTVAFADLTGNFVTLLLNPTDFRLWSESGGNVVATTALGGTLTITGATLAALGPTNFVFDPGFGVTTTLFNVAATTVTSAPGGVYVGRPFNDSLAFNSMTVPVFAQGGGLNDFLGVVTGGAVYLQGNGGNDNLSASNLTGNATLRGGQGNDFIFLDGNTSGLTQALVLGDLGNDTISVSVGSGESVTIRGLSDDAAKGNLDGDDSIDVDVFANGVVDINGNGGNDTITVELFTSNVQATVRGGAGDDVINVTAISSSVTVLVRGDLGSDTFSINSATGSNANISVFGGNRDQGAPDGNDSIFMDGVSVSNAVVLINGQAGNDSISITDVDGDSSVWTVRGGQGDDIIVVTSLSGTSNQMFVRGDLGNDTIAVDMTTGSSNFLSIGGSAGDAGSDLIVLSINQTNNSAVVNAGTGNDTLTIGTLSDVTDTSVSAGSMDGDLAIRMGAGSDVVQLNFGSGEVTGTLGTGNDLINAASFTGTVSVALGAGADTLTANSGASINVLDFVSGEDQINIDNTAFATLLNTAAFLITGTSGTTVSQAVANSSNIGTLGNGPTANIALRGLLANFVNGNVTNVQISGSDILVQGTGLSYNQNFLGTATNDTNPFGFFFLDGSALKFANYNSYNEATITTNVANTVVNFNGITAYFNNSGTIIQSLGGNALASDIFIV